LSSTACTSARHPGAVHEDLRAARGAQRHVQHGAVLGDVDLVAAEHGVDALAQVASSASCTSSCSVSSVIRCLAKSK
jgi:hypothetical protein